MGLPDDYRVDGILGYGTWDLFADTTQIPHLRDALDAVSIDYQLTRIEEPLIGHAYELLANGQRYWFVPVMGTAVMATYLHIGSLLGSRMNVLLGTAGGLAPGMKNGDLIIPTEVVGNDNALMYDRENVGNTYLPDEALLERLRGELSGIPGVWSGVTTTCEMLLAETQQDVDEWSSAGMLGVEMEGAMTFALSRAFGVPAVALFFVVDNLIEGETLLAPAHQVNRIAHEQQRALQYRIGLNLLLG